MKLHMRGTVVVLALVIALSPAGPKRRNLEMPAAGFAVLMCWSRIYLRARWLSYLTAGVALGADVAIEVPVVVAAADEGRTPGSSAPLTEHIGTYAHSGGVHNAGYASSVEASMLLAMIERPRPYQGNPHCNRIPKA